MLFLVVEAVRGRPLSKRVKEITQQVGLGLLLLLDSRRFGREV
jgi:membrane-associated protease RseP (regulator of RpoE activity)